MKTIRAFFAALLLVASAPRLADASPARAMIPGGHVYAGAIGLVPGGDASIERPAGTVFLSLGSTKGARVVEWDVANERVVRERRLGLDGEYQHVRMARSGDRLYVVASRRWHSMLTSEPPAPLHLYVLTTSLALVSSRVLPDMHAANVLASDDGVFVAGEHVWGDVVRGTDGAVARVLSLDRSGNLRQKLDFDAPGRFAQWPGPAMARVGNVLALGVARFGVMTFSIGQRGLTESARWKASDADAFEGDVLSDGSGFLAVERAALVSLGVDLAERSRRTIPFVSRPSLGANGELVSGKAIVTRDGAVLAVDDPLAVAMTPIFHAGHFVIVSMGAEDGFCAVTWLDPPAPSP